MFYLMLFGLFFVLIKAYEGHRRRTRCFSATEKCSLLLCETLDILGSDVCNASLSTISPAPVYALSSTVPIVGHSRRLRCKREKKCRFESCAEQNQSNELQTKRGCVPHKPTATGDFCYYFYNDGNFVPIKIEARRKEVEEAKMMPLSPKAYLPAALSDWDFSKKEWTNGEAADAAAGEGMGSASSGDKRPSRRRFGYKGHIKWTHKNPSKAARTVAAPSSSAVEEGREVEDVKSRNIPFRTRLKSTTARFFGCFGDK